MSSFSLANSNHHKQFICKLYEINQWENRAITNNVFVCLLRTERINLQEFRVCALFGRARHFVAIKCVCNYCSIQKSTYNCRLFHVLHGIAGLNIAALRRGEKTKEKTPAKLKFIIRLELDSIWESYIHYIRFDIVKFQPLSNPAVQRICTSTTYMWFSKGNKAGRLISVFFGLWEQKKKPSSQRI